MKVAIFGDFSGYTKQFSDYFDNNGSPDLFGDLLPVLAEHDLNIYHQEFPLTLTERMGWRRGFLYDTYICFAQYPVDK